MNVQNVRTRLNRIAAHVADRGEVCSACGYPDSSIHTIRYQDDEPQRTCEKCDRPISGNGRPLTDKGGKIIVLNYGDCPEIVPLAPRKY